MYKLPQVRLNVRIPQSWVLAFGLVVCLGLWSFAGIKQEGRLCSQILVEIKNDGGNPFLSVADIKQSANMINGHEFWLLGRPWYEINLAKVEQHINNLDFVDHAKAWKDHKGNLHLDVWQMEPFVRLMTYANTDRYLDIKGNNYPVSPDYTTRVLIADGPGVEILLTKLAHSSELTDKREPTAKVDEEAHNLFSLLLKIHNDPFLKALITQISVDGQGEVTLYPQVGHQVILFGKPDDQTKKFRKLEAFYNQIVAAHSWDKYRSVNLKFENQIICE